MIRVVQEFGAHAGRQLTFSQERVRFGRAPTNEVVFDPNVDLDASASHCEIVREPGGYVLVDAGSRNGTYVNAQRIQRHPLRSGDVFECGRGGPRLRVEIAEAHTTPGYANGPAPPPGALQSYGASTGPLGGAPHAPYSASAPQGYPQHPPQHPLPSHAAPVAPQGPPGGYSVGSAMAAQMPAGAQVGKRTVALMIDAALVQAQSREKSSGLKVAMVLTVLLVLAGLVAGGVVLYLDRQENNARMATLAQGDGAAGERITSANEAAIYLLAALRPDGRPQGFCTAFAVTPSLLATNAHCVDAAREHQRRGASLAVLRNGGRGEQTPVVPVFRDPRFRDPRAASEGSGFDVGLLRALVPLPVQVRLASMAEVVSVRPGASIYVYGFPGNTMNEGSPVATITQGVVNRLTDFFDRAATPVEAFKVQHTAQTTSGSSGSPIFLASGVVIGINAGSIVDEERQRMLDPRTGQMVNVEVNRSSNFKYGMRADLIRGAIVAVGETAP